MQINFKKYFLYLIRWQLSTPILAIALIWLNPFGQWPATIVANFIGGLIFFWVDKFIFTSRILEAQWEVKENISCFDCNKLTRGYRLVKTGNYDMTADNNPKFRCEDCSQKKTNRLRIQGIGV